MKSYQYFIELLIAGAGTFIWILLLAVDVFGVEWFKVEYAMLQKMSDGVFFTMVLLLFPFLYVSGIITDRVSDFFFDKVANIKVAKKMMDSKEEYQLTKARIFMSSTNLRDLYEYGRMRSRICRDWTLNSILILLASNYLIWMGNVVESGQLRISLFVSGLLITSSVIAFLTWRNLIRKEYRFIKLSKDLLKEKGA